MHFNKLHFISLLLYVVVRFSLLQLCNLQFLLSGSFTADTLSVIRKPHIRHTHYDKTITNVKKKSFNEKMRDVKSTLASVYSHYLHLSCYYLQFDKDWKGEAVGPAVKTINYDLLLEDVFCNVHTNIVS